MIDGYEIKCKKCGNTMIDIKGTATKDIKGITTYETKVRVKFTCLFCGYEAEVPIRNPEMIGDVPANFSDKREFCNLFNKE